MGKKRKKAIDSKQRILKATNKDENTQKYNLETSKLYSYYIEFEYDGIAFESTPFYMGKDNLNDDGSLKGEIYKIDSNAKEREKSERIKFNSDHGTVVEDGAYDESLENKTPFEYIKDGHNAYLKYDERRAVKSRSFVKKDTEETEYLWLYQLNNEDMRKPSTEYLKYINLGLVEREDVDLSIVQDV